MEESGWIRLLTDVGRKDEPGYYGNPRAELANESALRVIASRPVIARVTWQQQFLATLASHLPAGHAALDEAARGGLPLRAYDPVVVAEKLLEIRRFRGQPLLLREVSSQLFFEQSKALDGKEALIAALLEEQECPFPEAPIQVNVSLPVAAPFEGILFIENLTSFETLARRRPASSLNLALVFASGYRSVARRIRTRSGASVYFAAEAIGSLVERNRFTSWLRGDSLDLPVAYYGDLDYSGMEIIARLRATYPNAGAWVPGYDPMLQRLRSGGGHTPESAGKDGQRDPGTTGCPYADGQLLPEIRKRGKFVDQEVYEL